MATGSFNTTDVRPSNQPQTQTSQNITFDKPYVAPPRLPFGFNSLEVFHSANIRANVTTSDISKTGFTAHGDTWSDTRLYSAGASWLELAPARLEFQTGQFSTMDDHPWDRPQLNTQRRINFAYPYVTPPKVICFLNQLDMSNTANWRVKAYVTDIDVKGFTIHIDTWFDSVLYSATAGWIAYPEDNANIASGNVNTMEVRAWENPQVDNTGKITFPENTFNAIPTTFMAINWLDIDKKADLRIRAYADNVFKTGMNWHLDAWDDTVLYSAGAAWLAIV